MKTPIKKSSKHLGPIFVMVVALSIWVAGCAEPTQKSVPDPLAGWKSHNANFDPPNITNIFSGKIYYIDKAVLDDYPQFIEQLKEKQYPGLIVSRVDLYEDGAGQHAVKLTLEVSLREYLEYYIIYNKSNVRTNIIKGNKWHQFHM